MSQSTQETVRLTVESPSARPVGSQARARLVLIVTRLNEILKAAPMDWETRNRLERSLIDVDWVLNHFAAKTMNTTMQDKPSKTTEPGDSLDRPGWTAKHLSYQLYKDGCGWAVYEVNDGSIRHTHHYLEATEAQLSDWADVLGDDLPLYHHILCAGDAAKLIACSSNKQAEPPARRKG